MAMEELDKSGIQDVKDGMDDVTSGIDELKGILFEALGGLPFKIGVFLVVFYNMLYLFYKAFFVTRVDEIIQDDCYCDQRDEIIYRLMTFIIMGAWILFLIVYAFFEAFSFSCSCRYRAYRNEYKKIEKHLEELEHYGNLEQLQQLFLKELNDMVTTYYLDDDHYNYKKQKLMEGKQNRLTMTNSCNVGQETKESNAKKTVNDNQSTKSDVTNRCCCAWSYCACSRHCCFMLLKLLFIIMRFLFRLVIIPLLQLQWLNNYAWNCIFNNVWRDYCATITNEYFIGLDHSLVIYLMYVFLLLAILFSIIIGWFPEGTPKIILKFKGDLNSLRINVTDSKKIDDNKHNQA